MKPLIYAIAFVMTTACATKPPDGTVARIKYEARKSPLADCMKFPERYGFPNTRSENADLAGLHPGLSPNVYSYCRRVAQIIVS